MPSGTLVSLSAHVAMCSATADSSGRSRASVSSPVEIMAKSNRPSSPAGVKMRICKRTQQQQQHEEVRSSSSKNIQRPLQCRCVLVVSSEATIFNTASLADAPLQPKTAEGAEASLARQQCCLSAPPPHLPILLHHPLPGCSCVQLECVKARCPAEGVVCWRLIEFHEEIDASILCGIVQVRKVFQEAWSRRQQSHKNTTARYQGSTIESQQQCGQSQHM